MLVTLVLGVAHAFTPHAAPGYRSLSPRPPIAALTMQQQEERGGTNPPLVCKEEALTGVVQPTTAVVAPPPQILASIERLMGVVTGGSGTYGTMFWVVLIVSLHAVLVFGTLSGVLLDASIVGELGVPRELVTLGNSLVFFGWIPGAIFGGPIGDAIGRKPAMLGAAVVGGLGMCATGLVPAGDAAGPALLAARLVTGIGLGAFVSPAFALLVESSDPRRAGQASVTWTWGYVGGVMLLCGLHLAVGALGGGWRAEELLLGGWILTTAVIAQALVVESPRYLFASGATLEALDSATTIGRWNGVDLPAQLESDAALRALRDSAEGCVLVEEGCNLGAEQLAGAAVAGEASKAGKVGKVAGEVGKTGEIGKVAGEVGKTGEVGKVAGEEEACVAAAVACASPMEDDVVWTDLFSSVGERRRLTLTLGAMEVAYNMAFYVIVFSAGALSDQLLLNLVLLAAVDLPGSALAGSLIDRIGAKPAATTFLAGACALLFALAAYDAADGAALLPLLPPAAVTAGLSLLAKSMCTGAFTAIFLLFTQCYPTKLRSAALGTGNMFGKMGAATAAPLTAGVPLLTSLTIAGGLLGAAAAAAATLPAPEGTAPTDGVAVPVAVESP